MMAVHQPSKYFGQITNQTGTTRHQGKEIRLKGRRTKDADTIRSVFPESECFFPGEKGFFHGEKRLAMQKSCPIFPSDSYPVHIGIKVADLEMICRFSLQTQHMDGLYTNVFLISAGHGPMQYIK
jgi:hypothetical protein